MGDHLWLEQTLLPGPSLPLHPHNSSQDHGALEGHLRRSLIMGFAAQKAGVPTSGLVSVLLSQGCQNKVPQTRELQTTQIDCLMVLKARAPHQVSTEYTLSHARGEGLSVSPASVCWYPSALLGSPLPHSIHWLSSPGVFTFPSLWACLRACPDAPLSKYTAILG